ncbi:hypothetical protein CLOM_g1555 [Closterium sp. NIES-68]|nr:hypothetical protein CLOM_g1555 [Closterium sp. NIES-68]GJP81328.1 hypothetical protein CLOP_g11494 [Closterium sp. NIES-67]GJP85950.1 hypothetical protein CLOP_g16037 [Closterium sp. NIES-67]
MPLQFCVVGSGPAGFYTAEKLLKRFDAARVDIVERLPSPFGLVRTGVAPDHPETKNVINQFTRVAQNPRCRYFGNVRVGPLESPSPSCPPAAAVTLDELRRMYNAVILAYGAEGDRDLNVPGENLRGVFSAREFVWWYNGHPDYADLPVDLTSTDTAVVVGQGNVALDVARVLLRWPSELQPTDIAEHALEALARSQVRRVHVVGRRGPVQAACTAKEVREVLKLEGVQVTLKQEDFSLTPMDERELKASRSHRRVFDLLSKAAAAGYPSVPPSSSSTVTTTSGSSSSGRRGTFSNADCRELDFVFFRSPVAVLPREGLATGAEGAGVGEGCVGAIRLEKNILTGDFKDGPRRAVGTGETSDLPCGLVFKSIGYRSLPIAGLPFNQRSGTVPNELGRVLRGSASEPNTEARYEPGLYVVGWLKRGPTGIVGTNLIDAEETVSSVAQDAAANKLLSPSPSDITHGGKDGGPELAALLKQRGCPFITFEDWMKLDAEEVRRGVTKGRAREKIVSEDEVFRILVK